MIFNQTKAYGEQATAYMTPILCVIAVMVLISGTVFFIPGFNTANGRYMVFFWWFAGITLAWNIWWWYILFNGDPAGNACNWECNNKGIQAGTQAYKDCLAQVFTE